MRVPSSVHQAHPWVMDRIAPDFRLLDVWELPVDGRREDFAEFVDVVSSLDPARAESAATRWLFALRYRLGAMFGWDDREARPIPGTADTTLRDRVPTELRGTAANTAVGDVHGFTGLYRTEDEWAAEISNATVHGVLQLTWVDKGGGRYGARLAVYVRTRGFFGRAYLMAIEPFRYLVVYPAITRQIGRGWAARRGRGAAPTRRVAKP